MSTINDMGPGTSFQSVLDDPIKPKSAEKVIFTCGRHYYTLLDERKKRNLVDKVALVRIEELCPFPTAQIGQIAARYPSASSFMFAQEEPRNCGAWSFARPRLEFALGAPRELCRPSRNAHFGNGQRCATQATDQWHVTSCIWLKIMNYDSHSHSLWFISFKIKNQRNPLNLQLYIYMTNTQSYFKLSILPSTLIFFAYFLYFGARQTNTVLYIFNLLF